VKIDLMHCPALLLIWKRKKNFTEGFYLYKIASIMEVNLHLMETYIRITLCAENLQLTNKPTILYTA